MGNLNADGRGGRSERPPKMMLFRAGSSPALKRAAAAATAAAAGAGAYMYVAHAAPPAQASAGMAKNRVLGGAGARHRVAITSWPINEEPTNGLTDARSVFEFAKTSGYDGLELTVDDWRRRFFRGKTAAEIVREVSRLSREYDVATVGSLYHISDGDWRREHDDDGAEGKLWDLDWSEYDFDRKLVAKFREDKQLGSEYITFQLSLPPRWLHTGGEYRDDPQFIKLSAERIARLQRLCFSEGLNCYIETHIDRITEDCVGFARIMDACPEYFEVNADISHYNYRGIKSGPALAKVLARVGHTHQRMAREHGDLSADVPGDPGQDWDEKGLTWQAMESMKPALKGGLSSRVVVGESGPMHLVKGAIQLDAKLVPLYRRMAAYADAEAGIPTGAGGGGAGHSSAARGDGDLASAEAVLAQHFGPGGARAGSARAGEQAPAPSSVAEAEAILARMGLN
eukprot:SAG22_NODE_158_length_16966_cov_26.252446_5_plen_456_part_00